MDTLDDLAKSKCGLCGTDLDPTDKACPSCGAGVLPPPVTAARRSDTPQVADDDAPSRWPIVLSVLGIVGAFVVIALAVAPFFKNRANHITLTSPSQSVAVTLVPLDATTVPVEPSTTAPPETAPAPPLAPAGPVVPALVQASCTARGSTDSKGNPISFKPENTTDNDPATAWRCDGDAHGVTIDYALGVVANVATVGMIPGYDKIDEFNNNDRFVENRRVTTAVWHCIDSAGVEVASVAQTFADSREMQSTPATGFAACQVVRLEITGSTSPGSRDYTAISDISIVAA